jgi:uncharacterized GH25 family protein
MERVMMKKYTLVVAVILLVAWMAPTAQAHMLWLNASQHYTEPGETIWIEIGWGHKYPRDQFISAGRIKKIYAVGPDGKESSVEMIFPSFYKFTPSAKGVYQIFAELSPGFSSITTQGHKRGNKKELKNVVTCRRYRMNTKTFIQVGGTNLVNEIKSNGLLEIVPMKDLKNLKVGNVLPLKIMFNGSPLAGAQLYLANERYIKDQEHSWVKEKLSDSNGMVHVKLTEKGAWSFNVEHSTPYPDTTECDNYLYRTSLTIGF